MTKPLQTAQEEQNQRIKKLADDLIYLVSCALNENKADPDRCASMELDALYRYAQFHSLTSAAAEALEQVMTLPLNFDQAQKKNIRKLALFDIERTVIMSEFNKANIWYLPLKGILLKNCYPKTSLREMTDNDILCDSKKMPQIKEIMTRLGYTCESFDNSNHDIYTKPPTITFELHRQLFGTEVVPRFQSYYQNIESRLLKADGCARMFSDDDFYIYLIAHLYKHYFYAGTGLRSLADIYVFYRKHGASLDRGYIDKELKALQIDDFERLIRSLSEKVFNNGTLSPKEEKIFAYLLKSGAKGNRDVVMLFSELGGKTDKHSKRSYFLRQVFITGDKMQKLHPFIYKHKVLYPSLWVYRSARGIIRHPKELLSHYRSIQKLDIEKTSIVTEFDDSDED